MSEKARYGEWYRFTFLVVLGIFLPHGTDAALLYFAPETVSIYRGDTVTLELRIDTDEGECINAADVTVEYDPRIRAVDVSRGNSILNVWVEEPQIDEDQHTVTFAGGLPGGYCGRVPGDPRLSNVLAELVFRSPGLSVGARSDDPALVTIAPQSQVLLNDGLGTRAPLRVQNAEIILFDSPGSSQTDDWNARVGEDDIPPADFSITLTRDETAFSGKYFIVFNSQDKQSGIDHYEVMEEPFEEFDLFKWGAADAPWVRAESPYVLKDQTLNSTIRVKAIDKAANETIAVLVPEEALRSMSEKRLLSVFFIVATSILVIAGISYGLIRRRRMLLLKYQDHDETRV